MKRSDARGVACSEGPGVLAWFQYMRPQAEPPYCLMYPPVDGGPQENCAYEFVQVHVSDARLHALRPNLDAEGFELHDAPSAVADMLDEAQVRATYYPELVDLARLATVGQEAIVFDHQVRRREKDRRALTYGRHGFALVGPAGRIHNDYTEQSGRRRLGLVLGDRLHEAKDRRFCVVNVWRPITHPVVDTPLGLCDARSVRAEDFVVTELRYPDRTGEAYQVIHRPEHRWAYFNRMHPDEAIVFKQYDSALNVARFTPHAAFELPNIPPDAPLRTSIEARVLVLF